MASEKFVRITCAQCGSVHHVDSQLAVTAGWLTCSCGSTMAPSEAEFEALADIVLERELNLHNLCLDCGGRVEQLEPVNACEGLDVVRCVACGKVGERLEPVHPDSVNRAMILGDIVDCGRA